MTDEVATVREWTDLLARIRIGTVKVAGKNITGARIKAVAGRLATYADSDGTRVRPGLCRIAVDLEIDHGSAKRAVQWLAGVGLLALVRPGARSGHADEYRLAIPADLLERVEVWSPARHRLETERVREGTRGRYRRGSGGSDPDPDPDDLQVPQGPAGTTDLQVPGGPAGTDLQVPQGPAGDPDPTTPAGAAGTSRSRPAGASWTDLQVPEGPATDHGPRHNYDLPTEEDLRTAVTVSRASGVVDEPDSSDGVEPTDPPPRPAGCADHGPAFTAGTRDDGQPACPLCRATRAPRPRHDPDRPTATVIPMRRRAS